MTIRISRAGFLFLLLSSTIGCDQVSKTLARDALPITGPLTYLGDHLRLEYAENAGAFMSLGAGLNESLRFWVFTMCTSFFMVALAIALFRTRAPRLFTGFALILSGGLGNLIDRLSSASVTDFAFLSAGPFHTGIFNVADVAIVAGALILGVSEFRDITLRRHPVRNRLQKNG